VVRLPMIFLLHRISLSARLPIMQEKVWTVTLTIRDANGTDPEVEFTHSEVERLVADNLGLPICMLLEAVKASATVSPFNTHVRTEIE